MYSRKINKVSTIRANFNVHVDPQRNLYTTSASRDKLTKPHPTLLSDRPISTQRFVSVKNVGQDFRFASAIHNWVGKRGTSRSTLAEAAPQSCGHTTVQNAFWHQKRKWILSCVLIARLALGVLIPACTSRMLRSVCIATMIDSIHCSVSRYIMFDRIFEPKALA